jgi:hypothetical protein
MIESPLSADLVALARETALTAAAAAGTVLRDGYSSSRATPPIS